jgi:hypothetical protein
MVLKVTALVGELLWSNAKGGEGFDKYDYCTASIRMLASLEPNILLKSSLTIRIYLSSLTDGPMHR